MTELFMDTASCQAVKNQITQAQSELETQITTISTAIDNMVGQSWRAPGATQYQGDFQEWVNAVKSAAGQLNDYATRLGNEIQQWEDIASQG